MRRVAVAGHVCVDLVPELGPTACLTPGALIDIGPLAFRVGGCVANTARTLADLGHPVTAYATAGTDELAGVLRTRLHHPLIDQRLTTRAGSTSYSLVLEPGADRTFWHHVGVNSVTDGADIPLDDIDLLHLGYPSLLPALLRDDAAPLLDLLQRARDAGVTTSLDLAVIDPSSAAARIDWAAVLPRIVAHVDIISPSVDDLASAIPELADGADAAGLAALLSDWGAAVAVVSAGTEGVALHTGTAERLRRGGRALAPLAAAWADTVLRAPARTVAEVRTTNGAGDASTAGLLYAVSHGMPPRDALRLATMCAAAAVSGLPAPQETTTRLEVLPSAAPPETATRVEVLPSAAPPETTTRVPSAAAPAPATDSAPMPVLLPANQPAARFYRGGERIAQWRGSETAARSHTPEDWVASVVAVRDSAPLGMTTLPDGGLLRDAVDADPVGWLGPAHVARYGPDPLLLVKILDAGQRLPVHAHPDGDFARRHLGAHHGKAEAWHILTPGVVHLGLRRDVAPGELARLVAVQDTESLLVLLHEVPVAPGDRVFVPPGVLHAIGEGVLLVEVQEPEDLSILLEWRDFTLDGEKDGHLGLGFGRALTAVDHRELDPDRLDALVRRAGHPETGLPPEAAAFFRLDALTVRGTTTTESGFAVLVGLDGDVEVDDTTGLRLTGGSTAVVPAAHGSLRLTGAGTVLVARPPAP